MSDWGRHCSTCTSIAAPPPEQPPEQPPDTPPDTPPPPKRPLHNPVQFLESINSTFAISKIELLPLEPTKRNANEPIGDFAIIEARWGAFDGWADVTDKLQANVKDGRLHIPDLNVVLAKVKDPAFGREKALIVVYQHRGNTRMTIVPSAAPTGRGGTLTLPEKDKVPSAVPL